jgi:hypothetical protein
MLPQEDDVRIKLQSFHDAIATYVLNGWNEWLTSSEFGRSRYERTRACIVWERIVANALVGFHGIEDVREVPGHETTRFLFGSTVLLRFKKADSTGMSRSYPTQLALSYHDHQNSMFGELARVEVVYTLNALKTRIIDIRVVARRESTIAWAYSIMPSAVVAAMPPVKAPVATPADELVTAKIYDEKTTKSG